MADKPDQLFDAEEALPAAPEVTTQEPPQAATQPAVTAPEPPKPVVEPTKPEPVHAPLAALLDERDRRQKAERERDELRARHQKPQNIPSVQDDPDAFAAHIQEATQRAVVSERFSISETMATEKHGDAVVKAAMEWGMERAQASPAFAAEYMKQKHPIDWAVRQHKREKLQTEIGDDADAWVRKRAVELGIGVAPAAPLTGAPAPAAAPQPVAQPKPATPSPSLASAPSAGGPSTSPAPVDKVLVHLGLD